MFYAFTYMARLLSGFGPASGMILALVATLFTGQYYSWLAASVRKEKLEFQDLKRFDASMFILVLGVSFILFVARLILSPMVSQPDTQWMVMLIYFFIVFGCNALPEAVYIHRYESIRAYAEALKFTKDNWIEWYLPFLILLFPLFFLGGDIGDILHMFALISPLFPGVLIISAWAMFLGGYGYAPVIFGFLIAHWFMLFRGFLYNELSSGSRRRRVYLAKQK